MSCRHGIAPNSFKYSLLAFPAAPALCLLAYVLSALQPVAAVLTTCYDPSGDVRPDVPCFQNAVNSYCCAQGWVCTNASLCIAGPKVRLNPGDPTQFEGSCTDSTWNSPACPSFCRQGNLTNNAANGLWDCSGGNWCCSVFSGDTTCCNRNAGVFYLGSFVNVTTIGGAVGPGFSTSSSSSSATSSISATTTTASSTSAASPTSAASSASAASLASAAASTSALLDSGSSGLGSGAKAGIGVGVAVGLIVVAAFGFFIWRNRKTTTKLKEQIELLSAQGNHVQKDPRLGVGSYYDQERHELSGHRAGHTAELPGESGRVGAR